LVTALVAVVAVVVTCETAAAAVAVAVSTSVGFVTGPGVGPGFVLTGWVVPEGVEVEVPTPGADGFPVAADVTSFSTLVLGWT
jgi:hypothetical protein